MKSFFSLILLLLFIWSAFAQVYNPVKWDLSYKELKDNRFELVFKASIEKNWHLYSQNIPDGGPIPTSFTFTKTKGYNFHGNVAEISSAIEEFDKSFNMKLSFFSKEAVFKQIVSLNESDTVVIKGFVEYMVCDNEKCLPPTTEDFQFILKINNSPIDKSADLNEPSGLQLYTDTSSGMPKGMVEQPAVNEIQTTSQQYSQTSLLWFFILAFMGGLVSILMPCVFPMIPMTVTFFMHSSASKVKARLNALFFSFSIIFIYSVFGILISVFLGPDFINSLSTDLIPNLFFFIIFIVFAASFFGLFEITLPSWLISKSDKMADRGGYIGAFFMAFTLVLVSFSCTVPIVGTILVEASRGAVLKPAIGMLGFSLAFALPFGFFAFFPSKLSTLPKSGGWLNSLKIVLGFIELALSMKFLMVIDQTYHLGLLSRDLYLAIWITLFTLQGFYLLGKIKFKTDSDLPYIGITRLAFVIITFSFVVYLIPGLFGAPLRTLSGYLPPQTDHNFDLTAIIRENKNTAQISYLPDIPNTPANNNQLCDEPKYNTFLHLPHGLTGYFDYQQALSCARKLNKPLFIDFTGHGCVNCREMEQNVWSHPDVLRRLADNYVIVALYVDDKTQLPESEWKKSEISGKMLKTIGKINADLQIARYGSNSQPNYVLLDTQERLLAPMRAHNLDIKEFVQFLDSGYNEFVKRYPQLK